MEARRGQVVKKNVFLEAKKRLHEGWKAGGPCPGHGKLKKEETKRSHWI